ncbi:MAG: leucine-rich repeat domain-containing protein, partial [Roseomonas sp.]|nr:leucine-rich repeat domain-containing protein [Roseomonas sp.]
QQLQYLDCSVTKVSDLTPIAGLRQLQRLYCSATQISDLTPIAGLLQLQRLNCSHTKVSDLTPIAGLQQLQHLDCNATQVSDLTPIAGLIDLEDVDAENCSIGFVPNTIKNLKKLVFLDLSNNKIKRLPRELGELGDLERLRLEGNPLEDPLPALIAPGQPQATINILRWLRGEPIEPEATEPDPAAPEETADDPPAIPEQGAGPRVVLDQTGRLVFAKPSDLDAKGNDRNRLEALHPALRKAATELAHALQNHPSNLRNERLLQKAEAYRALVDLPLDEVNFARLYGAGMQLLNAAGATRRALEAGWVEVPDLTPVQDECLANIENLHPPFVLASRDGQEMLADQSLIQLTSEDVQAIKAAGTALGNSLLEHGDLAEPAVGQTITDAAAEIGEGINDKRDAATAVSALRNGLITLTATSVVVCLPILGTWVIGGVVGTAAGGLAALTLNEAVKKTKAFQVTTGLMAQGLESFTERQFAEFTGRLKRHREQLLKQEPQLRRIAHIWGFKWVGPSLDWLKRNSPPDKKE